MGLTDRPNDNDTPSDARRLWDDSGVAPASPAPSVPSGIGSRHSESIDLAPMDLPRVPRSMSTFEESASPKKAALVPDKSGRIESARDFPLWSRGQESGSAFFRVFVIGSATFALAWLFADWQTIHISGWITFLGSIATVLAAYPLVIGLERPVRSSPERAVRDFFESLEHHNPLYRRMWLLLTPEAHNTRHYTEFAGFRSYWAGRVREWRHRGDAWPFTPVVIKIGPIRTDAISAAEPLVRRLRFSIAVSLRGRRASGHVARYELDWTAERGRDGQWYLLQANPPE